jgi:hypothetical protein
MKQGLAFLSLLLLGACGPAPDDISTDDSTRELVGGHGEHAYPAVGFVSIRERSDFVLCTGTLVDVDIVVTAAHCVQQRRAGELYWVWGASQTRVPVRRIFWPRVHDDPSALVDDVAALVLAARGQPMPRPLGIAQAPRASQVAMVIAYGRTAVDSRITDPDTAGPRKSGLFKLDRDEAGGTFTAASVAAGTCWGDSGAPLLVGKRAQVAGVVHGFADPAPVYRCSLGARTSFATLTGHEYLLNDARACSRSSRC